MDDLLLTSQASEHAGNTVSIPLHLPGEYHVGDLPISLIVGPIGVSAERPHAILHVSSAAANVLPPAAEEPDLWVSSVPISIRPANPLMTKDVSQMPSQGIVLTDVPLEPTSSSDQCISNVSRTTITDFPESTFSRVVSITSSDSVKGKTIFSATPFFTILSTSTQTNDSFATFTHTITNPTGLAPKEQPKISQTVETGIIVSIGMVALLVALICFICQRRRHQIRRGQWINGFHQTRSPNKPFADPPMVVAAKNDKSAYARDSFTQCSALPLRPRNVQLQPSRTTQYYRGDNQGRSSVDRPYACMDIAIAPTQHIQLQSNVSLAPSTSSEYSASLPPSVKDLPYGQELSTINMVGKAFAPQPIRADVAIPPLQIPVPTYGSPPAIPPRSLSRPKSASLLAHNPSAPSLSHLELNTLNDKVVRPIVHVTDRTATTSKSNQVYARSPAYGLKRQTLLDVHPRLNRMSSGGLIARSTCKHTTIM